MERQAARLREAGYTGNVVFFEATDAARREHLAFPQYSPFWANVAGTPLTDGERACFASHYRLWKKCAEERPASGMVVLEDDAEILPEAFVETVEECVRAPWECVRIFVTNERPFRRIEGNFYTCEKGGDGAVGYFLRPSAAEKFLRASVRWLRLADDFLDRYWEHGVAYVVRRPYPLRLLGLESAIDAADGATRGGRRALSPPPRVVGAAVPRTLPPRRTRQKNARPPQAFPRALRLNPLSPPARVPAADQSPSSLSSSPMCASREYA